MEKLSREQTMALLATIPEGERWEVHVDADAWQPEGYEPLTEVRVAASEQYPRVIACNTAYYPTGLRPELAPLIASVPALAASHLAALDEVERLRAAINQAFFLLVGRRDDDAAPNAIDNLQVSKACDEPFELGEVSEALDLIDAALEVLAKADKPRAALEDRT